MTGLRPGLRSGGRLRGLARRVCGRKTRGRSLDLPGPSYKKNPHRPFSCAKKAFTQGSPALRTGWASLFAEAVLRLPPRRSPVLRADCASEVRVKRGAKGVRRGTAGRPVSACVIFPLVYRSARFQVEPRVFFSLLYQPSGSKAVCAGVLRRSQGLSADVQPYSAPSFARSLRASFLACL